MWGVINAGRGLPDKPARVHFSHAVRVAGIAAPLICALNAPWTHLRTRIREDEALNGFTFQQWLEFVQLERHGTKFTIVGAVGGATLATCNAYLFRRPPMAYLTRIFGSAAISWYMTAMFQWILMHDKFENANRKLRKKAKQEEAKQAQMWEGYHKASTCNRDARVA